MDRALIDKYVTGVEKLKAAIFGLSRQELLALPSPGANVGQWSIQQVVLHLMDAELIWTARMKSIIAEDNPQIVGFDESRFAAKLHYDQQDVEDAIRIFDLNRRLFAKVLRALPDAAFARTGRHNERGTFTLAQSLQWMVEHVDHHVKFIHAKRARMNKD